VTGKAPTKKSDDHASTIKALKQQIRTLSAQLEKARQKEQQFKEAHQTLLTVLDSIDASIYAVDLHTHEIVYMNRCMREEFDGNPASQICWQFLYKRSGPCDQCLNNPLVDGQGNPTGVKIWEGMNPAQTKWLLHHNRAIRWLDQRLVGLHVTTDISAIKQLETERRQTETRLRQAQKLEAIGTLAGGIAHDFNNILSAILGYSELALDDANKGNPSPMFISRVLDAGNRAHELVQQILTFSRQTETEAKPIQVRPIIKEALKLLRASLPSTIEIRTRINSEAIIKADPIQVHQVIMNLCTNAGHAMQHNGGILNVHLEEEHVPEALMHTTPHLQPGAYLKMVVSDTGHGIDPDVADKIFDPYFTTKSKDQGTGMGLAVVQGIVHAYGGAVGVESSPGEGAAFSIYFPILKQTRSAPVRMLDIGTTGNEHILLVDDEVTLTELGKELLQRMGYRVTACTDSVVALDRFQKQPYEFDLVITDMTMPHLTGDLLAERLIAVRPDIPIVICTGYSQKVTQEMIDRLGIRALVLKPIVRNELGMVIRQVLDGVRPPLNVV